MTSIRALNNTVVSIPQLTARRRVYEVRRRKRGSLILLAKKDAVVDHC